MKFIIPDEIEPQNEKTPLELVTRKLCACGRMFEPYRSFQRYCCEAHRLKYGKGKASAYVKKSFEKRICQECGKEYETNDDKRHYCSKECYLKFQEKRRAEPEERVCLICEKKFMSAHWSKRYCSKECRMEARRNK